MAKQKSSGSKPAPKSSSKSIVNGNFSDRSGSRSGSKPSNTTSNRGPKSSN